MSIEPSESYKKVEGISRHELVDNISKEIISGKNPDTFPEFIRDTNENPLTSDDLFELLRIPGEVGLSEEGGKVILTIGDPGKINSDEFIRRSNHGRLCFHSHVPREDTSTESSISVGDIIRVNFRDGKNSILMHADGFIIYGDAIRDPESGETLKRLPDNKNLLEKYLSKRGYTLIWGEGLKKLSDLKVPEQLKLSNDFAEKSGMIRERIPWDDDVGIRKILDLVNLRDEI